MVNFLKGARKLKPKLGQINFRNPPFALVRRRVHPLNYFLTSAGGRGGRGRQLKPKLRQMYSIFIYLVIGVYVFPNKPVLKINIADGINSTGALFLRLSLGFCQKIGFKTKPRQRSKFLKNLFLRLSICVCQKPVLKLNLPREVNSDGRFSRRRLVLAKKRFKN